MERLGSLAVEATLKFGRADFAAGERHGLENALKTEGRFLVLPLAGAAGFRGVPLDSFVVTFGHKSASDAVYNRYSTRRCYGVYNKEGL
jgi:hypothetical protein